MSANSQSDLKQQNLSPEPILEFCFCLDYFILFSSFWTRKKRWATHSTRLEQPTAQFSFIFGDINHIEVILDCVLDGKVKVDSVSSPIWHTQSNQMKGPNIINKDAHSTELPSSLPYRQNIIKSSTNIIICGMAWNDAHTTSH